MLQYPMIFVREHEQLAGHTTALQHVERGQTLGDGEAIIQLAVYGLTVTERSISMNSLFYSEIGSGGRKGPS